MKRLLMSAVCLLAIGATAAQAELISADTVRTTFDDNLDKLVISISGFDSGFSAASTISALEGEFTADSTNGVRLSSSLDVSGTTAWYKYTLNSYADLIELLGTGSSYFSSYVNLDSTTGSLSDNSALSRSGSDSSHMYTSYTGNWFTTDSASMLGVGDVIAVAYVATGTNVSFSGQAFVAGQGTSNISFSTSAVPEPSTLALLACGLFGLLAYAWRRRK